MVNLKPILAFTNPISRTRVFTANLAGSLYHNARGSVIDQEIYVIHVTTHSNNDNNKPVTRYQVPCTI